MSERKRYWPRRVAELESSGLSRAAFCRRHRINYQTMTSWVKRFRDEDEPAWDRGGQGKRGSCHCDAAGFVEVSLPAANALAANALVANGPAGSAVASNTLSSYEVVGVSAGAEAEATSYEVLLGNDRSIRVGGDFDEEALARLIRVVVSC